MLTFFSNCYDIKRHDAKSKVVSKNAPDKRRDELFAYFKNWYKEFKIGEPEATDKYTVEELKKMHYVGLYLPDDPKILEKIMGPDHGAKINDTSDIPPLFSDDEPADKVNE